MTRIEQSEIEIAAGDVRLPADIALPARPHGLVIFAHGSGSSRRSPRNRYVAAQLHRAAFGTVLFDLLTPDEQALDERTGEWRFDIALLGERLRAVTEWLSAEKALPPWRGYFGASTGAAAALVAAAELPQAVHAVVSRGGRPDLAGAALDRVETPTQLIVGGNDRAVLELNEAALRRLRCAKELVVVPGATHLFEEPGALDAVCAHAASWLERTRQTELAPQ
jgi:putative phosphoribosyl transferase